VSSQDASTYYSVLHPHESKLDWAAFYRKAEMATEATRAELRHQLNLPYGQHIKQRLDLYFPPRRDGRAPVFMFLHGGGFREGDRAQYGFIAGPLAQRGVITAVSSYRLTGDGFRYPSQGQDARLALHWLSQNIQQYGGDADRLYLGGHSCGAIVAADLGVDRGWLAGSGMPKHAVRGIVGVSAPYDLRTPEDPSNQKVFWGRYVPTPDLRAMASPMLNIVDPVPAVLLAAGSTENVGYDDYVESSKQFAARLSAAGVAARYLSVEGANHQDTVLALGQVDSELSRQVAQIIAA
jgi:acetyl esterase/lipase